MSFKPIEKIPKAEKIGVTNPDYDAIREELRIHHPQQAGCIQEGLTRDEARKLRQALMDQPHFFACVRSGKNLPPGIKGPAAVFGGYALSEEQIQQAKGEEL